MVPTTRPNSSPAGDSGDVHEHRWVIGEGAHPDRPEIIRRCAECGAGHTLTTHRDPHGYTHAMLDVYPPTGRRAVERRVVACAVRTAAATMRDRERAGERVVFDGLNVHGDPIDDPEIESMAQWLVSSSSIAEALIDDAIDRLLALSMADSAGRRGR